MRVNARNLSMAVLTLTMGVAVANSIGAEEKAKEDTYPLTTCVVSGDKLGEMGDPVVYTHEGREIRFCCKSCIKDFEKNPDKYLAKLDRALAVQAAGEEGHDAAAHAAHGTSESANSQTEGTESHSDHGHEGHSR